MSLSAPRSPKSNTSRKVLGGVVLIAGYLSWASPGVAVIPPVPKKDLESSSTLVAEITVMSTTLKSCHTSGPRKRCGYTSSLRIDKVLSGKGKLGAVVRVGWGVLSWVGTGRAPPGPWSNHVTFYPCERAKVYLIERPAGTWHLAGWNAKRSLGGKIAYDKMPQHAGQSGQCVHGKAVLGEAPPAPVTKRPAPPSGHATRATSPAKKNVTSSSTSAPQSANTKPTGHGDGCSVAPARGESSAWGWIFVFVAALVMRRRRR